MDNFRPVPYNIRLNFQRCLLKKVTPNLRRIHIDHVDQNIFMRFFYHNHPSPLERKFVEAIKDEMKTEYPFDENGKTIEYIASIEQCPYPIKPSLNGQCVYARYEPTPTKFSN